MRRSPRHGLIPGRRVVPASRMSLRARVGLLAFVAVFLAVGLAVGIGYYFAQRELHQEVDQFLARRAETVAEVLQRPADLALQREHGVRPFIGRIPLAEFDAHVQILNRDGHPIFAISSVPLPVGAEDRQIAREARGSVRQTVRLDGQRYRILTASLGGNGAVQVARDLGETDRALNDLLRRTIPLGVILAAAAAAMAWLLARRALRPVEQLTRAARHVAQTQELAGTIEVYRADEVGQLARSFNAMLEALQISRRQQRQLVSDAGHELRTPLTSIRANIEMLQRAGELDEVDRERIFVDVNAEIRELSELVGELVELAGDAGVGDEPSRLLDLAELADDAADRARRRTGRELTTETVGDCTIQGRAAALERAIDNLVGNAAKFSPADTPIRIRAEGGRLEVHDRGPGIPPADRPLVFERFYRAAGARSAPGSGLGLAIVKQIVESHGGRVFADSAPDGGASVGFELPEAEAEDS